MTISPQTPAPKVGTPGLVEVSSLLTGSTFVVLAVLSLVVLLIGHGAGAT